MRPTLRPAAAVQTHEHGQYIYAYSHVRTNQVLYSLKRTLDGHHSLKQLPDIGANDAKAEGRIRRDLWRPFFSVAFPPTPPEKLSPHGSNTNAQGLHAYRQLRQWRLLHEYHWTPPASLAMPYTEEQKKDLKKRYDERGGSKKETVYDIIKREKKKIRRQEVQDQKANSVADLAAVLQEQANAGVEMEIQSEEDRTAEVKAMIKLAKQGRNGEVEKLQARLEQLRPYLARKEGFRIEDGAPISQRQAKQQAWKVETRMERIRFATGAVEQVTQLLSVLDAVVEDVETQIATIRDESIRNTQNTDVAATQTEESDDVEHAGQAAQGGASDTEPAAEMKARAAELRATLAGVRKARSEILNYGRNGLAMVKEWIDDARQPAVSGAEDGTSQPTGTASNAAEAKDAESSASQQEDGPSSISKPTDKEHNVSSTKETEGRDAVAAKETKQNVQQKKEADDKVKGYELVVTAIVNETRIRVARKREKKSLARQREEKESVVREAQEEEKVARKIAQEAEKAAETAATRNEGTKRRQQRESQMKKAHEWLRDTELHLPDKLKELDAQIAELEQIPEPSASQTKKLFMTRMHRVRRNAQLESFKEIAAIRSNNAGTEAVADALERKLLELAKLDKVLQASQVEGEPPIREIVILTSQMKIFRQALGAERDWPPANIQVDTEKDRVSITEQRVRPVEEPRQSEIVGLEFSQAREPADVVATSIQLEKAKEGVHEAVKTEGEESTPAPDDQNDTLGAAWLPVLPSFPPELVPPQKTFPKRQILHKKRVIRRRKRALFSMKGVKVKFNNVLDAEFAAEWPEDVEIMGMGLTKGMSMPKAEEEPIYGEVEWVEKRRERAREKKAVIEEMANEVIRAVSHRGGKDVVPVEEKQIVVKEEVPLVVQDEKPLVVKDETAPVVKEARPLAAREDEQFTPDKKEPAVEDQKKDEEPMIQVEDRSSVARRGLGAVRGWFGR